MDCIVLIDFGQDAFAKARHEVLALLPAMDLAVHAMSKKPKQTSSTQHSKQAPTDVINSIQEAGRVVALDSPGNQQDLIRHSSGPQAKSDLT